MFLCVLRLSFAITWPSGTKSWNYLKRTTLKKNVGSQAHRLTVNFLKEHPFKYIWINKVKSEKGICPKNLELFLIHLVVVNFRPRRNAINLVISFFWGGRWGVGYQKNWYKHFMMNSESLSPHCIYLQWRCVNKLNAKLSTSKAANDDNTAASINIYHIIMFNTNEGRDFTTFFHLYFDQIHQPS